MKYEILSIVIMLLLEAGYGVMLFSIETYFFKLNCLIRLCAELGTQHLQCYFPKNCAQFSIQLAGFWLRINELSLFCVLAVGRWLIVTIAVFWWDSKYDYDDDNVISIYLISSSNVMESIRFMVVRIAITFWHLNNGIKRSSTIFVMFPLNFIRKYLQ